MIKILFDSGANDTIISKKAIGSIKTQKNTTQRWNIAGGAAITTEKVIIQFNLGIFTINTVISKTLLLTY